MKLSLPITLRRGRPNLFWLTPTLAVGGADTVRDPARLRKLGIAAVLDMQAEAEDRRQLYQQAGIRYLKSPVIDFHAPAQDQLVEATGWVLEQMQADQAVFIHCRAGLGRSVTMALAILLRIGYELPEAYRIVQKARPEIRVTDAQLAALREFAAKLVGDVQ